MQAGIGASAKTRVFALMCTVMLMSVGCASIEPLDRTPYQGADLISTARASQVVGIWQVKALNPAANAQAQQTTIEYRSDGTVAATVLMSNEEENDPGTGSFRIEGNWSLQGDILTHTNITMTSLESGTVGTLLSGMINSSTQNLGDQANIQELSDERMVLLGSDGAAMVYTRQQ